MAVEFTDWLATRTLLDPPVRVMAENLSSRGESGPFNLVWKLKIGS